jgi:hypothetical protein
MPTGPKGEKRPADVNARADEDDIDHRGARRAPRRRMQAEAPKATGGKPYQATGSKPDPVTPTLADLGIDKHLADRARKYAAVLQESSRLSAAMYLFPLRPTCAPSGVEQPKDGREREQDDSEAERRPMPRMGRRRWGNLFCPINPRARDAERGAPAARADGVPGAAMADRKARAALAGGSTPCSWICTRH